MKGHFLIVGLGLIGGSYAMGLAKKGHSVFGIDTNQSSLNWALEQKIISEGCVPENGMHLLQKADYIVLGIYPSKILTWLKENKQHIKNGAIVTDVAGVKNCFIEEAQSLLAPNCEFIGCHPMAGREVSGVQNADDAIFKNANFIITPTDKNTKKGIDFANYIAKTLQFGKVTELSVQEHDTMIGYVSQLTHAIAVSLINANNNPHLPDVTGDSFRDLTRIADINSELWSELFLSNAPILTSEIDLFVDCLQNMRKKIADGDRDALVRLFEKSTKRRREFAKK